MTFFCQELQVTKKSTFKQHIENLCRKTQYKLHALRRIRKFLTKEKAILWGNVLFIDNQFNYALLRKIFIKKSKKNYHKTLKVIHLQVSLIWNNPPAVVMSSNSLFEFKNKIKNNGNIDGGCLICRNVWYMMLYSTLWFNWNLLVEAISCTSSK